MDVVVKAIGCIETPYEHIADCPRNIEPDGPLCSLIIDDEFSEGLFGLETGRKILVLYWLDKGECLSLRQTARSNGELSGVFALRTPNRPNPIGAAIVKIEKIENSVIQVRGLDCLNGTPLLDIKPAMRIEIE